MSGTERLENVNPEVFQRAAERPLEKGDWDDSHVDFIDDREVYDLLRNIADPEHPLTLEELGVVSLSRTQVDARRNSVTVFITPTIPHCSMATLIGLSVKVKLVRCLPNNFFATVRITPGSHNQEAAINKQLADKERVAAALENPQLLNVVNQCLASS